MLTRIAESQFASPPSLIFCCALEAEGLDHSSRGQSEAPPPVPRPIIYCLGHCRFTTESGPSLFSWDNS